MSLKHHNFIAFVLILLSAVCWVWGQELMQDVPYVIDVETTYPMTRETAAVPTPDETIESSQYRQPNEPGSTQTSQPDPAQTGSKTFGFILCVFAALSAGIAIFLLWQQTPLAGPDGICMLVGIAGTACCALPNLDHVMGNSIRGHTFIGSSIIGNPAVRSSAAAGILVGCTVLLVLRELWGWARVRFSSSWYFLHRIVKRCPLPQVSLLIFVGWILSALAGVGYHLLWSNYYGMIYPLPFWGFVAALSCGILCLWGYGSDLKHFQKQLTNYQNGAPITVGDGTFAQTEAQLLKVQAQHEEALRTAVTSERFKVELIANVSHDLRTPLTSILGYSELLQQEELSPEGRQQLRQLHQKAGYMSDLVESLFELTKVSSGVVETKQEEIDLVRLLEQTIGLFDDQLVHAGLAVRRNYCSDSIPVITDGARMHQVFANLLGNAIKYALTGTRIYLEVRESEHSYLVRMTNTASYEMDFQPEEILQRFARGDKARSTKGSGLGLAIAQTYTDSVGGDFRIFLDGDQFGAIVELPKTERNL